MCLDYRNSSLDSQFRPSYLRAAALKWNIYKISQTTISKCRWQSIYFNRKKNGTADFVRDKNKNWPIGLGRGCHHFLSSTYTVAVGSPSSPHKRNSTKIFGPIGSGPQCLWWGLAWLGPNILLSCQCQKLKDVLRWHKDCAQSDSDWNPGEDADLRLNRLISNTAQVLDFWFIKCDRKASETALWMSCQDLLDCIIWAAGRTWIFWRAYKYSFFLSATEL